MFMQSLHQKAYFPCTVPCLNGNQIAEIKAQYKFTPYLQKKLMVSRILTRTENFTLKQNQKFYHIPSDQMRNDQI